MRSVLPSLRASRTFGALAVGCCLLTAGSSGPHSSSATSADGWPDPAFLPDVQCHGLYPAEDLNRFMPRARVALWLPGTRSVAVDSARRCITIRVESLGAGRLAELVIRGVSVPRRAVLLEVDPS